MPSIQYKTRKGKKALPPTAPMNDIENIASHVVIRKAPQYSSNHQISDNEDQDGSSDEENITSCTKEPEQSQQRSLTSPRCAKRLFQDKNVDHGSSPPKQKKDMTPGTPSQLISKLHLHSPASSNTSFAKLLSPKKLFDIGLTSQNVQQALHNIVPDRMPGREKELNELKDFFRHHLQANSSGTLYVSGPPGTGKTACLSKLMLESEFKNGYKTVYVNCTAMKSAISIYQRIAGELGLKTCGKNAKDFMSSIVKHLPKAKKTILLVLDEIDQLDTKDQSVLYTIFEWPSKIVSKLVLVGIANALDLTDRILPRLQARMELKPKLMHFTSYSKEQIVGILSERLKETDNSHVFTPQAVQLVAAKVASVSGDARRALDIARRVFEIADNRILPLQPTTDHVANTRSPKKTESASVKLQEVVSVLNTVYGTSQTLDDDSDDSFPLLQKILLCSLVLIITKGKFKEITISKLYDINVRVCKNQNLPMASQSEFLSLCGLIESRGMISIQPRKEPRLSQVGLQWDAEELSAVLKDKQLLASIMKDSSCLLK